MSSTSTDSGRAAQRRRTRKAIVDAAAGLLAAGADPSIGDIAASADVSRRTIYMYFPTLDQLLLDATSGAMNTGVDAVLASTTETDPRARAEILVTALCDTIGTTLPLGRKLIKLTVDDPPAGGGPKRGYRRIGWIEQAVSPLREPLGPARFERLVSALSLVLGWEAFVVLYDVRGLDETQARQVLVSAALALIDAAETW
ncbi:MAG TPA: TetR/AcrR family transcriptional regulator [Streptosporangiaceae bacterium]|jgi:AcrR family transcriptional regulator